MKKTRKISRVSSLPVFIMVGFAALLFLTLFMRVYLADRDLALERVERVQSLLAAESGLHFSLVQFQRLLNQNEDAGQFAGVSVDNIGLEDFPKGWKKIGIKADSAFRITEVKKIPYLDRAETPLVDESGFLSVTVEGRSGGRFSRANGILASMEIVKKFAVMNSLNEFYYGAPIQFLASRSGSLDAFVKANADLFASRKLTARGIIHDPKLLYETFQLHNPDPFNAVPPQNPMKANFGTFLYGIKDGESPCDGPLYCRTPIIVDSHIFKGPIQTASYFFRRTGTQPRIQIASNPVALNSSRRVQIAKEKLEGDIPEGLFVDQDSQPKTSFWPSWKPNFNFLRQYAKKNGIYVDAEGRSWNRGEPSKIDYHLGTHKISSEKYLLPASMDYQRDEINESFIVLSTPTKFQGQNNIEQVALKGARVLLSENSIFIRGEIGGDLAIVTPKHIYLTGSTNDEGNNCLFLIAGEGIALSTHDLENYIKNQNPALHVQAAARNWYVKGVLFKPGAGWFCDWSTNEEADKEGIPSDGTPGQKISLSIKGACLEGNLKRWIDHASGRRISVKWDSRALDRLQIVPRTAKILRVNTIPQNF